MAGRLAFGRGGGRLAGVFKTAGARMNVKKSLTRTLSHPMGEGVAIGRHLHSDHENQPDAYVLHESNKHEKVFGCSPFPADGTKSSSWMPFLFGHDEYWDASARLDQTMIKKCSHTLPLPSDGRGLG